MIRKRLLVQLYLILLFVFAGAGQEVSYNFDVSSYDLLYEINADLGVFKSEQKILIKNISSDTVDELHFLLHPLLVIDGIAIYDSLGASIAVNGWKADSITKMFRNELKIIEVHTGESMYPGHQYQFHLEYHMLSEAFKDSEQIPDNALELVISSYASYAIGPSTGHFAIFNNKIIAPFELSISYPEGNLSCAPGSLITTENKDGYFIDTYRSMIPNIPAFSCAPYEKKVRQIGNKIFEFYLYPGQQFDDEMASIPAQYLQLYTSSFGETDTDVFRFGNIGAADSRMLHLENKGNAVYMTDLITRYYTMEPGIKDMYNGLIAHELFHNWNIFSINWTGQLTDWFEEGGANFIASWASEIIMGKDFADSGRLHFISSYAGETGTPGYAAKETLATVSKENSGDAELMLIYYYGALVWEQLRQKVGDECLLSGMEELFSNFKYESVTYKDFLKCIQDRTTVDVENYLGQWITTNAAIDLSIGSVNIQKKDEGYVSEIEIYIYSDNDFELYTSIGYRTSAENEMSTIDLHTMKKGIHKVEIQTEKEPVSIQIDPAFRVPQINLENNIWRQL